MAQDLVTKIRLDDKQFKSVVEQVKGQVSGMSGTFTTSSGSIKKELRSIQNEMANMLLNGVNPASSEFSKLSQRAGEISDAMGDAKAMVRDFANDTRGLSGVANIAETGTNLFQVYTGSLAMFGIQGEEASQVVAKLGGAMSVLSGVEQLQSNLVDQSTATYRAYHAILRLVGAEQANNTVETEKNTVAEESATIAKNSGTVARTETTIATESDTVAKGANTTATEGMTVAEKGATVASKGLRLALAQIGIGLVIAAVTLLITHWKEVYGWFVKTFPAIKNIGGAFDKLKVVAAGVGNAILQFVITPLKAFATMANDIINGEFKKAISDGFNIYKQGYNVIGNYQKGAHAQQLSNQRRYNKKAEAEQQRHNEKQKKSALASLEKRYKDENAKYGKSGKRDEQYYKDRLAIINKYGGSQDEKDEAQRGVWQSEREQIGSHKTGKVGRIKTPKISSTNNDEQDKIKEDKANVSEKILEESQENENNAQRIALEAAKEQYEANTRDETITSKEALDERLKQISVYYDALEKFRKADYNDEVRAINAKYDAEIEKAHGDEQLIAKINQNRASALANANAQFSNSNTKLLSDLSDAQNEAAQSLTKHNKQIADSSNEAAEKTKTSFNNALDSFGGGGFKQMFDNVTNLKTVLGSDMATDADKIGASLSAMGSSMAQLGQDSAAAKAGMVLSAIGQIVLGFAQATSKSSDLGIFGWIAAITAGTGIMIATISQLQSFSQGGIFEGNSRVGDHNLARVNSGEMILTRTQQGNLMRLLDTNTAGLGGGLGVASVRIKGSDMYLALSNYTKTKAKTGKITGLK